MNHNSGTKRSANSLDRQVRHYEQTYGSQEHESDLQMRQSPKPTLSTNRISKSKSQQQASFRGAFRLESYPNLFSTDRNHSALSELVQNWRSLSHEQLSAIPRPDQDTILTLTDALRLQFLLNLQEVSFLRRKLADVKLNVCLMEVEAEARPTTDKNKLLVLEILQKKLAKKLGIVCLRFNTLERKVRKLDTLDKQIVTNRSVKMVEGEMMFKALQRLVQRVMFQGINKIKKAVFLGNLLSPGSNYSEDEDQPPQQRNPSMLELTLSPNNNFIEAREEYEKGQISHRRTYPLPPSYPPPLHNQSRDLPIKTSKQTIQQSKPITSDILFTKIDYQGDEKQIKEVQRLLNGLEKDVRTLKSRFREDRQVKQKEVYFSIWKVQFLKRHQQALVLRWRYYSDIKSIFDNWKKATFQRNQFQDDNQINEKDIESKEKQTLKAQKKLLKTFLKKKYTSTFFQKLKDQLDTEKILKISRCVYENNLKAKVFNAFLCGLSSQQGQNIVQGQIPTKRQNDRQQISISPVKQNISTYFSSYEPQMIKQTEQESYQDEAQQIKSNENITAIIFNHNNLLTKYFFAFKRHHQLCRGYKTLGALFTRHHFKLIKKAAESSNKLQERLSRLIKQKKLVTKFRCFNVLKRVVEGSPPSTLIEGFSLRRERKTEQLYFSALKLMWKKYLIKKKVAAKLSNHHIQRRVFNQFRLAVELSQKTGSLVANLHQRSSVKFMRNLLRNYLDNCQLSRKVSSLETILFQNRVDMVRQSLYGWNKLTMKRRGFEMVVDRMRRLKDKETKARIFGLWFDRVFSEDSRTIEQEERTRTRMRDESRVNTNNSQSEARSQARSEVRSEQHRYWLEKYFESLSALGV